MEAADTAEPIAPSQTTLHHNLYQPQPLTFSQLPKPDHAELSVRPTLASSADRAADTPEPGDLPHRSSDDSNISTVLSIDSLLQERHPIRQTSEDSAFQAGLASPLSSSYSSHASHQPASGKPDSPRRQPSAAEIDRIAVANRTWSRKAGTNPAATPRSAFKSAEACGLSGDKLFPQGSFVFEPGAEPNASLKNAEVTKTAGYPFPVSRGDRQSYELASKPAAQEPGLASGIPALAGDGLGPFGNNLNQRQGMSEPKTSSVAASSVLSDPWQHRDALLGPAREVRLASSRMAQVSAMSAYKTSTQSVTQGRMHSGSPAVNPGVVNSLHSSTHPEPEPSFDNGQARHRPAMQEDTSSQLLSPRHATVSASIAKETLTNQVFPLSPHVHPFNPSNLTNIGRSVNGSTDATAYPFTSSFNRITSNADESQHTEGAVTGTRRDHLQGTNASPQLPLQYMYNEQSDARADATVHQPRVHRDYQQGTEARTGHRVQSMISASHIHDQDHQQSQHVLDHNRHSLAFGSPPGHPQQDSRLSTTSSVFDPGYPPEIADSLAASLARMSYHASPHVSGPSSTSDPSTAGFEDITTIFVVGFPEDFEEREFLNMFAFAHGFEAATLKIPASIAAARELDAAAAAGLAAFSTAAAAPHGAHVHQRDANSRQFAGAEMAAPDGPNRSAIRMRVSTNTAIEDAHQVTSALAAAASAYNPLHPSHVSQTNRKQIIGFAKFLTREDANMARDILSGRKIDAGRGCVLKAEIAKKNLHIKKSASDASVASRFYSDASPDHYRLDSLPVYNPSDALGSTPQLIAQGDHPGRATGLQNHLLYTRSRSSTQEHDAMQRLSQITMQAEASSRSMDDATAWTDHRALGGARLADLISPRSKLCQLPSLASENSAVMMGRLPVGFSQSAFSFSSQRTRQQPPPSLQSGSQEVQDRETLHSSPASSLNLVGLTPTRAISIPKAMWEQQVPVPLPDDPSPTTLDFRTYRSRHRGDDNEPIATLYVGGLPAILPNLTGPMSASQLEETLRAVFVRCQGFRRLSFRQKSQGPMCFIEFDDVQNATRALQEMYGHTLGGIVKGGIRLAYSKNPLGVRNTAYASNPQSPSPLSPSYFASDVHPLPQARHIVEGFPTAHGGRHLQQAHELSQSTPQQEQYTPMMAYAQQF